MGGTHGYPTTGFLGWGGEGGIEHRYECGWSGPGQENQGVEEEARA